MGFSGASVLPAFWFSTPVVVEPAGGVSIAACGRGAERGGAVGWWVSSDVDWLVEGFLGRLPNSTHTPYDPGGGVENIVEAILLSTGVANLTHLATAICQ